MCIAVVFKYVKAVLANLAATNIVLISIRREVSSGPVGDALDAAVWKLFKMERKSCVAGCERSLCISMAETSWF